MTPEQITIAYEQAAHIATRYHLSPENASDFAQDVLVRCLEAIGTYDSERAAFSTWAAVVAHSVIKNMLRDKARQKRDTGGPMVSLDAIHRDTDEPTNMPSYPDHVDELVARESLTKKQRARLSTLENMPENCENNNFVNRKSA